MTDNLQASGTYFVNVGAMQGWQCPVCKAVNSPWTIQCPCGGKLDGEGIG